MNIFNSLGSNYDFNIAINTLFSTSKKNSSEKLERLLSEKYRGKTIFTYKGREALRLALRISGMKGADVGICGFTCFAVYEAVEKEEYKPVYLDIDNDDLNFSSETLINAYKKNPKIKIVIIQNTLGYPCDMENISEFCQKKKIILIEDLAHSVGARYSNGQEAGTVGDFVMLSFSQDKVIDKVAGGALIIRNKDFLKNISGNFVPSEMDPKQKEKDRIYPISTYLIRKTYSIGVGKILHKLLKKTNLLSNPMEHIDKNNIHILPLENYESVYLQFNELEKNLKKRKKLASIYSESLDKKIISKKICSQIYASSNLRFPIFVEERESLIKFLKEANIYVSDIWNDAPIAPKKYLPKTDYKMGECPNAEGISGKILNLPTHKNVTEENAKYIADKINTWMKL